MNKFALAYGIPDELLEFVNIGFLEILSQNPDDGTIRFAIPSTTEVD